MLINCTECESLISDKADICVHCGFPLIGKANEKFLLTIKEASDYFGIGENKLRELIRSPHCDFILINGNKKLIKRERFIKYLNNSFEI